MDTASLVRSARKLVASGAHPNRCPNFHSWMYKGVRCEAFQCLNLNTEWAGCVVLPRGASFTWPDDEGLPFGCGADFAFTDGPDQVVGFHAMHVIHGFYEVPEVTSVGIDLVAATLRAFVDTAEVNMQTP